jgi:hypothetical protein
MRKTKQEKLVGGPQFGGKSEAYQRLKGTPAFADLQRDSDTLAFSARARQDPRFELPPSTSTQLVPVEPLSNDARTSASEISTVALALIQNDVSGVLALYKSSKLAATITEVRRLVRRTGAERRRQGHVAEVQLEKWLCEQNREPVDPILDEGASVSGGTRLPGPPTLQRALWRLPCREMAEQIMIGMGEPANVAHDEGPWAGQKQYSSHDEIRKMWSSRHRMYRHKDQANVNGTKPTKFGASLGRQLGMCTCTDRSKDLLLFRGAFLHILRGMVAKGSTTQASVMNNYVVFRLIWTEVGADSDADILEDIEEPQVE